jgi:hypothetical protein
MPIKITAKVEGFRRAGQAHYGSAVYSDERFTADELAALMAEPNLIVESVESEAATPEVPVDAPATGKKAKATK